MNTGTPTNRHTTVKNLEAEQQLVAKDTQKVEAVFRVEEEMDALPSSKNLIGTNISLGSEVYPQKLTSKFR